LNLGSMIPQRPRIFFGWWIVSLAGLVQSISSSAYNKGSVVFFLPVSESLGVSRASMSLVFALSKSEGGPIGPVAGWLIDRFGPKPLIFAGTIMAGTGFLLLAQAHSIWTFGLVYLAMITMGSDLAFSNGLSALINNWFHRRRALAMSSYLAISFLAPALLVPLLALLIASQGWRTAATVAGFTILGVALPLSLLVRNTPESKGLLPDGGPAELSSRGRRRNPEKRTSVIAGPPADYSLGEAVHTPSYWFLLVGTVLRLTAKAGLMQHIIPIMMSKGIEEQTAAFIFGLLLFVTVPFTLLFGWLADTLPKNLVLCVTAISGTAAFCLLASPLSSIWIVYLFVLLFAIAETSGSNNWATFGDYFGRKAYGRLKGITQLACSPGNLLAPYFAGLWWDRMQSYTLPLWVFTVFFGLGALSFGLMRRPKGAQRPMEKAATNTA
jgi:OFA family oxalate/formate antiporter-like MFS transporter